MMDVRPHQDHLAADERQVARRGPRATISDQTFEQMVDLHGVASRRFLLRLTHSNDERVHEIYQENAAASLAAPRVLRAGALGKPHVAVHRCPADLH
jgi:hypothetical protein